MRTKSLGDVTCKTEGRRHTQHRSRAPLFYASHSAMQQLALNKCLPRPVLFAVLLQPVTEKSILMLHKCHSAWRICRHSTAAPMRPQVRTMMNPEALTYHQTSTMPRFKENWKMFIQVTLADATQASFMPTCQDSSQSQCLWRRRGRIVRGKNVG